MATNNPDRKLVGQLFGTRVYVVQLPDGTWAIQWESAESREWEWYYGIGGTFLWWPNEAQAVEAARASIQRIAGGASHV